MNSVKALAEMNLKISSARAEIMNLEATKEKFLKNREEMAKESIKKAFLESQELLTAVQSNHDEIRLLAQMANDFSNDLVILHAKVKASAIAFNSTTEEWERNLSQQITEINGLRKGVEQDRAAIERDKAYLVQARKDVKALETKVNDKYETLLRTQVRIKKNG